MSKVRLPRKASQQRSSEDIKEAIRNKVQEATYREFSKEPQEEYAQVSPQGQEIQQINIGVVKDNYKKLFLAVHEHNAKIMQQQETIKKATASIEELNRSGQRLLGQLDILSGILHDSGIDLNVFQQQILKEFSDENKD